MTPTAARPAGDPDAAASGSTGASDRLAPDQAAAVGRAAVAFVATADARGLCDCAVRVGSPGLVVVLDARRVALAEHEDTDPTSAANVEENPYVGLFLVDALGDADGLHVNGPARMVDDAELRAEHPDLPSDAAPGRAAARWIDVSVREVSRTDRRPVGTPAASAAEMAEADAPAADDASVREAPAGEEPAGEGAAGEAAHSGTDTTAESETGPQRRRRPLVRGMRPAGSSR